MKHTTQQHWRLLALSLTIPGLHAHGQEADSEDKGVITQMIASGKFDLDINTRYEHADQDTSGPVDLLEGSDALTTRTRFGYTTGDWNGISAALQFDNTVSLINDSNFTAPGNPNPGKTLIADPEGTAVNQAFIQYKNDNFGAKFGRQVIVLNDARFIGNVVWRQHWQTYDAARVDLTFIPDTTISYAYLDRVNRVFYDNPPQVDWESDSHLVHADYTGLGKIGKLTGYAYLLEFSNAAANSSDTFGAQFSGSQSLTEDISATYLLEYAFQESGDNNPNDYEANYYKAQGGLGYKSTSVTVGYEVLGSDDGNFGFYTPLSTLFKWNGWADTFLPATPGAGLADLFVTFKTKLPGGLPLSVTYHNFESDEGSIDYGWEIDALVSYQINDHWSTEARYAHYSGDEGAPGAIADDRDKFWFSLNYNF